MQLLFVTPAGGLPHTRPGVAQAFGGPGKCARDLAANFIGNAKKHSRRPFANSFSYFCADLGVLRSKRQRFPGETGADPKAGGGACVGERHGRTSERSRPDGVMKVIDHELRLCE
ncbi:hypothetical protein GCM10027360_10000 [Amycolatopsis echigonensis]